MAAGMGSRFGGLKQMTPVGPRGEVILDFSAYDAIKAGFTKIVFVIKHEIEKDFKAIVGDHISKMVKVEYAFQEVNDLPGGFVCPADRTKPWGTAQAILSCKNIVNEPFAVVNADDYYGKTAFKKMADFLMADGDDYAMVGFRLENTLTENGYVSRGICEIEDGVLTKVTERTKIIDCKFTEDDGATWEQLSPNDVVSMNLWGFKPDLFGYIEDGFKAFLSEKLNVPKAEYYLPTVVSELIASGEKKVNVLVAEEKWYGVTYKEDKEQVTAALTQMVNDGLYD